MWHNNDWSTQYAPYERYDPWNISLLVCCLLVVSRPNFCMSRCIGRLILWFCKLSRTFDALIWSDQAGITSLWFCNQPTALSQSPINSVWSSQIANYLLWCGAGIIFLLLERYSHIWTFFAAIRYNCWVGWKNVARKIPKRRSEAIRV